MLSTDDLLNGLDRELTLRFFATFARFEFALKQTGVRQHTADGRPALASRIELARRLPTNFFHTLNQAKTARTLIERPPKNLLVQNGGLEFSVQPPPLETTGDVLEAMWNVRNNLFHGNKVYPADRARDAALMMAVLAVIDAVLNSNHEIAAAFHEPQHYY
jgi:hypothetical protein